jgi:hypothetical protein
MTDAVATFFKQMYNTLFQRGQKTESSADGKGGWSVRVATFCRHAGEAIDADVGLDTLVNPSTGLALEGILTWSIWNGEIGIVVM